MPGWLAFRRSKKRSKVAATYSHAFLSLSYIGSHYDALAAPGSAIPLVTGNSYIFWFFAGTQKKIDTPVELS
jgi:hypothetical protein